MTNVISFMYVWRIWNISLQGMFRGPRHRTIVVALVCAIFAFTEVHNRNMLRKPKYYKMTWVIIRQTKTATICYTFCLSAVIHCVLLACLLLSVCLCFSCTRSPNTLPTLSLSHSFPLSWRKMWSRANEQHSFGARSHRWRQTLLNVSHGILNGGIVPMVI